VHQLAVNNNPLSAHPLIRRPDYSDQLDYRPVLPVSAFPLAISWLFNTQFNIYNFN
jgi:hypothetical protein